MQVTAGKNRIADLIVTLDDEQVPLSITITSSVMSLYGDQIRNVAVQTARDLDLRMGNLHIEDNQAYDFVIRARIIAVVERLRRGVGR